MKNKSLILFTFLIFSNCYGSEDAGTRLTLSPSLLYFDYTEFGTTNKVLDRELGWLPGLEADLSHTFTSGWSINVFSAYYQGTVDYTGQTQSGTPLTTDTGTKFFRLGGRVKKDIYKNIHLYVGAQQHRWDRDIKDTSIASGIDETYRWLEYSIGLDSDIFINQNNLINVDIAYLLTRDATIDVDLSRINLGSATLDIGDGNGGRISLSWKTIYTKSTRLGLTFFFEAWNFGRSNTKQTQGGSSPIFVTEPRSETRNTGLKFNFEYMF